MEYVLSELCEGDLLSLIKDECHKCMDLLDEIYEKWVDCGMICTQLEMWSVRKNERRFVEK